MWRVPGVSLQSYAFESHLHTPGGPKSHSLPSTGAKIHMRQPGLESVCTYIAGDARSTACHCALAQLSCTSTATHACVHAASMCQRLHGTCMVSHTLPDQHSQRQTKSSWGVQWCWYAFEVTWLQHSQGAPRLPFPAAGPHKRLLILTGTMEGRRAGAAAHAARHRCGISCCLRC